MTGLTKIVAAGLPIDASNIDTDQLLPARFLRKPRDAHNNYRRWLFHDLRVDDKDQPINDFVMNRPRYKDAQILVAGKNFGCGSSREGAVYALVDNGFKVIIAPSYGEIFAANCVRNGVAPLQVSEASARSLRHFLKNTDPPLLSVDLRKCEVATVSGDGNDLADDTFAAHLDAFSLECLINGIDEITYTTGQSEAIDAYEQQRKVTHPWLFD